MERLKNTSIAMPRLTLALCLGTMILASPKAEHLTTGFPMSQSTDNDNGRLVMRIKPSDKATIMKAAAIAQKKTTDFVLRTALCEARKIIEEHERIKLSHRDSQLVLRLLENPPAPNAKLRKAARELS